MAEPSRLALEIGAELVEHRAAGISWKEFERRYGYRRMRLWMLWCATGGEPDPGDFRKGTMVVDHAEEGADQSRGERAMVCKPSTQGHIS